jgi:hypothetical protein
VQELSDYSFSRLSQGIIVIGGPVLTLHLHPIKGTLLISGELVLRFVCDPFLEVLRRPVI